MVVAQDLKAGNRPTSVNNFIRHIKAVFGKAVEWQLVQRNPFEDARQIKYNRKLPGRIPLDQFQKFLESIPDPDVKALVKSYLATGRRR
jgi:site-specific recombinase XerD